MIRDLKMGFQIMKYGLNIGYTIFGIILVIVATIIFELALPVGIGGFYLGMGVMLIVQLIFSVSVSTMVQTSPHKKRLQTTIPTLYGGIFLLVANTVSLILTWFGYQRIQKNTNPFFWVEMEPGELETGILFTSGMMVFILLYTVLAMKCFWLGTLLFLGGFVGGFNYLRTAEITYPIMPTWVAVLLSYGIVLLGCLIMYVISCVTYKREYSKKTFEMQLKRAS